MTTSQWADLPLVLTSEQAAKVLQLTRRTITNMLDRGDLRGVKIGKEWRISRAELMRFVEPDVTFSPHLRQASDAPHMDAAPIVIDEGGILVVQAQPLVDLSDFVQRERGSLVCHRRSNPLTQRA